MKHIRWLYAAMEIGSITPYLRTIATSFRETSRRAGTLVVKECLLAHWLTVIDTNNRKAFRLREVDRSQSGKKPSIGGNRERNVSSRVRTAYLSFSKFDRWRRDIGMHQDWPSEKHPPFRGADSAGAAGVRSKSQKWKSTISDWNQYWMQIESRALSLLPPSFFPLRVSPVVRGRERGREGAEWRLPLGKSDLRGRSTTKGTFRLAEMSGRFAKILCVTKVTTWHDCESRMQISSSAKETTRCWSIVRHFLMNL